MTNSLSDVGRDAPITRVVIFLMASGLLGTMVTGGVFIGTMREMVRTNASAIQILERQTASYMKDVHTRIAAQETTAHEMAKVLVRIESSMNNLNTNVSALASYIEKERERQRERLDDLENQRNGIQ